MTGISYEFEIDDEAALTRLGRLAENLSDLSPFYKSVGNRLATSTQDNFEEERAPDGTPWKALQPATIRARLKRGKSQIRILREQGDLSGSVNVRTSATEARIGSPKEYAAIHQLGGTIKKKARKGKAFGRDEVSIPAHTITIPARPYIGIGPDDLEAIVEIADDWLRG